MKKKALEEELEDLEGKLLRAEKLLSGMQTGTCQPCAGHEQTRCCLT